MGQETHDLTVIIALALTLVILGNLIALNWPKPPRK